MYALLPLLLLAAGSLRPAFADSSADSIYTGLLQRFVQDGLVNYAGLCQDRALADYCDNLAATRPEDLGSDAAAIAFWINVYNAFTLRLICDHYPLETINDLHWLKSLYISILIGKTIWDSYTFRIDGRDYTLNEVEHGILRARYRDNRIHGALVCASISCPPLRREAYRAGRLDEQLDDNMRVWCNDSSKNRYDPAANTLYLSKIFDWYAADFETAEHSLLDALQPYLPPDALSAMQPRQTDISICFLEYDWSLNEQ